MANPEVIRISTSSKAISGRLETHRRGSGWGYSKLGHTTLILSGYLLTLARFPYFATFASGGGGGVGTTPPPGDRPLMVVELREKNQSMRLDEISRLHILFLVLGQHLT